MQTVQCNGEQLKEGRECLAFLECLAFRSVFCKYHHGMQTVQWNRELLTEGKGYLALIKYGIYREKCSLMGRTGMRKGVKGSMKADVSSAKCARRTVELATAARLILSGESPSPVATSRLSNGVAGRVSGLHHHPLTRFNRVDSS